MRATLCTLHEYEEGRKEVTEYGLMGLGLHTTFDVGINFYDIDFIYHETVFHFLGFQLGIGIYKFMLGKFTYEGDVARDI